MEDLVIKLKDLAKNLFSFDENGDAWASIVPNLPKAALLVSGGIVSTVILVKTYGEIKDSRRIQKSGAPTLIEGRRTLTQFLFGDVLGSWGIGDGPSENFGIAQCQRFEQLADEGKPPLFWVRAPFGLPSIVFIGAFDKVMTNSKNNITRMAAFGRAVPNAQLGMDVNGDRQRTHKRIVTPLFSDRFLRDNDPEIRQGLDELCDVIARSPDSSSDVYDLFGRFALDVIGRIAFETQFGCLQSVGRPNQYLEASGDMVQAGMLNILMPDPLYFISGTAYKMMRARTVLRKGAIAVLEKYKSGVDVQGKKRIISELLAAEGGVLSDEDILDEVVSFILAGHETTANTMCWMIYELGQNGDVQEEARRQVLEEFGSDPVTFQTINTKLKEKKVLILNYIMLETLRLHPTVPSTGRDLTHDTEIFGYDIPAGTRVVFARKAFSARNWQNPNVLEPTQFVPSQQADLNAKKTFAPFGFDPRSCIGKRLAEVELLSILVRFLQRFTWVVDDSRPVKEFADITMGPKKTHMFIRFTPRE